MWDDIIVKYELFHNLLISAFITADKWEKSKVM